jgi:hypothetical protein
VGVVAAVGRHHRAPQLAGLFGFGQPLVVGVPDGQALAGDAVGFSIWAARKAAMISPGR